MGFRCGIVGLPNVGKSTLFNALTETQAAQAANYPFCTIEPNVGQVAVPDERLEKIAAIAKSAKIIPTQLAFVDIAGLVKGASKGEGLGNQFLGNIREVDAIVHVLRCFEDDDIQHVNNRVDPLADAEVVETELMLSDLDSLERRIVQVRKRAQGKDKEAMTVLPVMEKALALLQEGKPVRIMLDGIAAEDLKILLGLNLLTSHPVLYVCNVAEAEAASGNAHVRAVEAMAAAQGARTVTISAAIEAEVAQLPDDEAKEFLADLGLEEPGLDRLIREGYALLDLITYFTAGPKETRAWTIERGTKAPQAAGVIHTDFERGFIRAQTIAYEDFVALGGEVAAKEAGKARDEGREYVVQDGDVLLFKFNT
jgi:ribosome-binding ATPase